MTRTPPRLVTLTLLTALSALTLNMILPSLPSMARDLGAGEAVTTLTVSGYMLASAVFQLVLGPLSDRFGRRPVMLTALVLYTAASLGCMLAQDVAVLLACRVMQAVIVAGVVVSSAVIRDQHSAIESAAKLSLISSAMAVAPMLGPMLGGFLDVSLGWRSLFALYAGLGGALLLLAWADMGETRAPGLSPPRLGIGVLLLSGRAVSIAALVLALALFAAGASHPVALFGLTVFVGLGNGLTLPTANAGALSVRPALAGTAAGLSGALAMTVGAVMSALTAVVVERSATPVVLLLLIMGCVLLSLAAALAAMRLESQSAKVVAVRD